MLKKLQKIGIKFNYLKLRYLMLFSFFSVENRMGKKKEFKDSKIMYKVDFIHYQMLASQLRYNVVPV